MFEEKAEDTKFFQYMMQLALCNINSTQCRRVTTVTGTSSIYFCFTVGTNHRCEKNINQFLLYHYRLPTCERSNQ